MSSTAAPGDGFSFSFSYSYSYAYTDDDDGKVYRIVTVFSAFSPAIRARIVVVVVMHGLSGKQAYMQPLPSRQVTFTAHCWTSRSNDPRWYPCMPVFSLLHTVSIPSTRR